VVNGLAYGAAARILHWAEDRPLPRPPGHIPRRVRLWQVAWSCDAPGMSDTMTAALTGAVVGSAATGLVTWLARWRDARAELRRTRSDAYLRFVEACSVAYALLEQAVSLGREHRWWKEWPWWLPRTHPWLARQLYGRIQDASRHAIGPYFAVLATGTPDAVERANRMFTLLQEASRVATTLADDPNAADAPEALARAFAQFVEEREGFLDRIRTYLVGPCQVGG
jgi:hypothetical protein